MELQDEEVVYEKNAEIKLILIYEKKVITIKIDERYKINKLDLK